MPPRVDHSDGLTRFDAVAAAENTTHPDVAFFAYGSDGDKGAPFDSWNEAAARALTIASKEGYGFIQPHFASEAGVLWWGGDHLLEVWLYGGPVPAHLEAERLIPADERDAYIFDYTIEAETDGWLTGPGDYGLVNTRNVESLEEFLNVPLSKYGGQELIEYDKFRGSLRKPTDGTYMEVDGDFELAAGVGILKALAEGEQILVTFGKGFTEVGRTSFWSEYGS